MKSPDLLKKGDTVYLLNIARFGICNREFVRHTFTSWGLNVIWGKSITDKPHCQFSERAEVRLEDLQNAMNNPEIKAIFFLRGGYGTVQIMDDLDLTHFKMHPKWLVGYSDITFMHQLMQKSDFQSIHATMLSTWHQTSISDLTSIKELLFENQVKQEFLDVKSSEIVTIEGELIGGNLSIVHTQIGTLTDIETNGKILVLEDVFENLMSIERMLWALRRSGKFNNLKAILLGDFIIPIKDNETSNNMVYGIPEVNESNSQQAFHVMISEFFKNDSFPVISGLDVGHSLGRNRALKLGAKVRIQTESNRMTIEYLN